MSTRARIVTELEAAGGRYLSGQEIARRLGVSRAAVWKHVEVLKRDGFEIESEHARGYLLRGRPDRLDALALRRRLTTRWLASTLEVKATTGSTNSDAAALARRGALHGSVVLADEQTAGKGRLGRTWESARGVNLYLSVVLRPRIVPAQAPQLSLVSAVAVAAALERARVDARIKWPNDVLVNGRKLCGILTEIEAEADRVSFVVVGIGVNLNSGREHFPPELHDRATSVWMETGRKVDRLAFLCDLLSELEEGFDDFTRGGFEMLRARWEARSSMTGRSVRIAGVGETVEGICAGIDGDGALLVDEDDGRRRRVLAGDVTLQGGYD